MYVHHYVIPQRIMNYIQKEIFREKHDLNKNKQKITVESCSKEGYSPLQMTLRINEDMADVYLDTPVTILHLIPANCPLDI